MNLQLTKNRINIKIFLKETNYYVVVKDMNSEVKLLNFSSICCF